MEMTVKDFLSKAWSKTDCVAIRDCNTVDQKPQYMAVMTAREGFGDWQVDSFSVDHGLYSNSDKVLHLWVYKEKEE